MPDRKALVVKNAKVMPVRGVEDGPLVPGRATGGVFNEKGEVIPQSLLQRKYDPIKYHPDGTTQRLNAKPAEQFYFVGQGKIEAPKHKSKGRYIFAGYLFHHYGHFLLESLAKLWFIKRYPDLPLIWVSMRGNTQLSSWQQDMLRILGVKGRIHIISDPLEVEELIIPDDGYMIQTDFTEAQSKALAVHSSRGVQKDKKIWLSRSKLNEGRYINDEHLENLLAKSGWTIFHPQDHDLEDQLSALSNAERISGFAGSAFHTLMFIKNLAARIDIFLRGHVLSSNYSTIAETLKLDQHCHYVPGLMWSEGKPGWMAMHLLLQTSKILKILGVNRDPVQARPTELAKNIQVALNKTKRKRLLLIGSGFVDAFLYAKTDCKILLDPLLSSDMAPFENDKIRVFEMTADQYFLSGAALNDVFDVIVVTGLGGDTLKRAIMLAQKHSEKGTKWLFPFERDLPKFCESHWHSADVKRGVIEGKEYLFVETRY